MSPLGKWILEHARVHCGELVIRIPFNDSDKNVKATKARLFGVRVEFV